MRRLLGTLALLFSSPAFAGQMLDLNLPCTHTNWAALCMSSGIYGQVQVDFSMLAGTASLAQGGTNQTSWTASRCVQVNAGGTALESAAAACGSGGGGSTPDCISVLIYSRADNVDPNTGITFAGTTNSCYNWSNIGAGPTYYGRIVAVDMEIYTHLKLVIWGANPSGAGAVTVELDDVTTSNSAPTTISSTTIPVAAACADHSSTTSNQTALTGMHLFAARFTATANDDPIVSDAYLVACNGAFN